MNNRIIGRYQGRCDGPLVIVTAAMHGNEYAGVRATELLLKMLHSEHNNRPDFEFRGTIISIIGNLKAYRSNTRYIKEDINRLWNVDYVQHILNTPLESLEDEAREMYEILSVIKDLLDQIKPQKMYLIDLHTTSSDGIFSIAGGTDESRQIALKIQAPLVTGLLDGLSGTTLHYFDKTYLEIPSVTIAFEGGHHTDPLSVNRCMAAVFQMLRAVGLLGNNELTGTYDYILNFYNKNLPRIVKVDYRQHVDDPVLWDMLPGFKNFDTIFQGQLLATYKGNEVYAPRSGYILMPLYQPKGHDGFFICSDIT